jgi:hypothetical protein
MAEPNPKIAKSRPSIPAGDDLAKFDIGSVPALPDADDIQHLNSLAAMPGSGDTDNFDIDLQIMDSPVQPDSYTSKGGSPVPLS